MNAMRITPLLGSKALTNYSIAGCLACAAWSIASALSVPEATSRALELNPCFLDFGAVQQGDVLRGNINLHNRSTVSVHDLEIVKSCTCTSVHISNNTLAPGDSASALLELSTDRANGHFEQILMVNYQLGSGLDVHHLPIQVSADVTPEVTIIPSRQLEFDSDEKALCELVVKSNGAAKVLVQNAYSNSTAIRVERLDGQGSGPQQRILVEYLPSKWNRITTNALITLETTSTIQSHLTVPVCIASPITH